MSPAPVVVSVGARTAASLAAGQALNGLVGAAGDVGKATVEGMINLLKTPIVLEFGGHGRRVGGRWGKRNQGTATYVRRLEVPMVVLVAVAWFAGYRPGGAVGAFMEMLLGPSEDEGGYSGWTLLADRLQSGDLFGGITSVFGLYGQFMGMLSAFAAGQPPPPAPTLNADLDARTS